jgi:hypothetical protein
VKATLEKHGLRARIDTSTKDEIHVAAYKSYHTTTPCRSATWGGRIGWRWQMR